MQTEATLIFETYKKAKAKKELLGEKGLYEQIKINERFYSGNQWYGANCGNDRPLVRHNIIKRIGDFKMSQVFSESYSAAFFADSQSVIEKGKDSYESLKGKIKKDGFAFSGRLTENEITAVCNALGSHYSQTADRIGLDGLITKLLSDAYITGTGILYTYFNGETKAGVNSFGTKVNGDIACEVLSVRDVYFGDSTEASVQAQPYIIIASNRDKNALLAEAKQFGTETAVLNAKPDDDGKILVLTKLYKSYVGGTPEVHCIKVTEGGVLRPTFDTRLHLYPLAVFRFGDNGTAYGESEIPYLIPNQIAINRMITASVWSNISSGMPMMVVNGDTVSGEISNEPGQIVKIYGTNEDVSGAIKFVSPGDFSGPFNTAINNLIENTLTQSGATLSALGDEHAQNASAIARLQAAAVLPLNLLKNGYKSLLSDNALIWADFWLNLYGNRRLRIEDEGGVWYFPFNAERYRDINISVSLCNTQKEVFSSEKVAEMLGELYDRGVITKSQYLSRLPDGLIPNKTELISDIKEEKNEA